MRAARIDAVRAAAERWRQQLVDTTGRNRLRNYRDLKTGTLDLTPGADNGPDTLMLDQLLAGRTVSLSALFPTFLDDTDAFDDARRRFTAIHRKDRENREEKGIATLFAAIGLAAWKVDTGTPPNAPVVLLPLEAEATGAARRDFNVTVSGDAHLNPVLTHFLREHGIDTEASGEEVAEAPPESLAGFRNLLDRLAASWDALPQLVIEPRVVAAVFSYATMPLVSDLAENGEQFAANDLIAAIAGDGDARATLSDRICDPAPDQPDTDAPADEFLVLDADSSQHMAINRVLGGESLVIQGPPGTGKSQTIANLITALIARGRRVLFVAEKRAAIEAVTKRLDATGLGDLVMDMHGGVTSRREFARTLADSLEHVATVPVRDYSELHDGLRNRRDALLAHDATVHERRDPWGLCLYHMEERLLAIPEDARTPLRLSASAARGLDVDGFRRLEGGIREWVDLGGHTFAADHPEWSRSAIAASDDAREAFDLVRELARTHLPDARAALFAALDDAGLARPDTVAGWQQVLELASGVERMLTRCSPDVYRLDHAALGEALMPRPGTVAAQALRHLSEGPDAEERSGLELAIRLADELFPAAREALEKTLGEVGGRLPNTVGEWREMVEFLLAIERTLARCTSDVYHLDHTTMRESLTVDIGMAGRVTAQLSMKTPDARREGHDLAARMATLLPDAREALFAALDEVGLVRPKTIGEWRALIGLLSDVQGMQEKCPSDIYRMGQIERKEMLPPNASRLTGILKSIFSTGFRDEKKVRDTMLQDMVRHDEAWARWSADGLHPRLPAGLDEVKKRIAVLEETIGRFQQLITTDTFADVEHDTLLDALLRVNGYWNARETLLATIREPEDLFDSDAIGLLDEVEGQIGEWGQRVSDGMPRVPHALAEANERLVALTDGLAAFTRMASVPSFDQAPHDNVLGALEALKEHWATREAVAGMLREPMHLSASEAIELVGSAGAQLDEWRRRRVDGGEPCTPDGLDGARERVAALSSALDALGAIIRDSDLHDQTIDDLAALLDRLASSPTAVASLPRLRELEAGFREAGVADVIERAVADIPPERAASAVEHAWLSRVLDDLEFDDRRLATFDANVHSRRRDEFIAFDREHRDSTPQRIRRLVAEATVAAMNDHPEQTLLVRREAAKKRKHLSVRQLFGRAPHVLSALRPCWTMSPVLATEMIPAHLDLFDVVVFDEASQIPPAEAIGSLARAPQAVIAGDSRQLPPTSFFGGGADDDGDDEDAEALTSDIESLLDAAGALLRDKMLQWHYRSRDDRLIAFSNNHIYGGGLTAFPGSLTDPPVEHCPVPFRPLPGVSGARSNPDEVERVVELVIAHARERPRETLGVIAFGLHHANNIENVLLRRLGELDDRSLDEFFAETNAERFFVKSIERVQGDERDAIILSVGYHKNAHGRLAYRFGPLNQEGGERRLNVAVTRARSRLTLVSSFSHHDMEPGRSSAKGVELLRKYLEFAASGGENLGADVVDVPLNPFELSIADGLERRGIPFTPQYGVSGYRIDFACAHPDQPGRKVLAIEADGASYHATPTARDRDRLRQQVLEDKGWRFHRIWSTSWFRDREAELDKAEAAWRDAVKADADSPPSEPVAPPVVAPPPAPSRGPRPNVPRKGTAWGYDAITDYRDGELAALARWIDSDGLLRTDDQLMDELRSELGFQRRGKRIEDALGRAIRQARG